MKVLMEWNCKSSTFCLSLRELRKPTFSLPKAASSGAKRVKPAEFAAESCELSWLINWVDLSSLTRTENFFAFVRIATMSVVGTRWTAAGVGAPLGVAGTRGTVLMPGVGAAAVGVVGVTPNAGGEAAGDWGNAGAGGDFVGG
ncbi:hypothetical protein L6164_031615 [Bauhinia variegata]|uniref:Uncharacterized protein n=1 Tax=Bauhinia variegata TaxID=167791 RepID=A0ACB9LH57_BAUVA|nr:hypothetical protein L6164_031615 [Bauhinia variegata]